MKQTNLQCRMYHEYDRKGICLITKTKCPYRTNSENCGIKGYWDKILDGKEEADAGKLEEMAKNQT